jgi:hypothetical protein
MPSVEGVEQQPPGRSRLLDLRSRIEGTPDAAGHLLRGLAESLSPSALMLRQYEALNGPIDAGGSYRGSVLPFERSPDGKLSFSSPRLLDLFPALGAETGGAVAPATERGKTTLGTFAGATSKGAPLEALEHAKRMSTPLAEAEERRVQELARKSDKTPSEIEEMSHLVDRGLATAYPDYVRQRTGWHQAPDGQWRHEISDHTATWKDPEQVLKEKAGGDPAKMDQLRFDGTPLPEFLDHPNLFDAYPSLKDVKVHPLDLPWGTQAAYDSEGSRLFMDPRQMAQHEQLSVVLHEIQHHVGHQEGFHPGGSPFGVISQYFPEVNAEFERLYGEHAGTKGNSDLSEEQFHELLNQARYNVYHRLLGEIESRSTENRQFLTPDQRKLIKPYETEGYADHEMISRPPDEKPAWGDWGELNRQVPAQAPPVDVWGGR